tara:strand:- start:7317 stop:7781 length:465 start_codon:yes stop_codon:yes gene_type:complete
MEVKSLHTGGVTPIESIGDAITALSDMGCAINGAYLMETELGGGAYAVFHYHALLREPNFEQIIERPSEPSALREWITELFDPFLYKANHMVRSVVDVHEYSMDEVPDFVKADRLFQLTLNLYLDNSHLHEAHTNLTASADDSRRIRGWEYCLD